MRTIRDWAIGHKLFNTTSTSHHLLAGCQRFDVPRKNMRIRSFIPITVALTSLSALGGEILPMGWLTPEQLLQAEDPIQSQLDTGQAMAPTAWDMAAVRDARLLLIYLSIYERLPTTVSRNKFASEQEAWLRQREKAVNALSDPKGGSMVSLGKASKHMELTQIRIDILQKQLGQMKNTEPTNADQPATKPANEVPANVQPPTQPSKAGPR